MNENINDERAINMKLPDHIRNQLDKATDNSVAVTHKNKPVTAEKLFPPLDNYKKEFMPLEGAVSSYWPELSEIKSNLPPAPVFDAAVLLPKILADFVLDEADRMPCAPDFIASALLVALGSVIGANCAIKPKRRDDWIVTPNLFGGGVGGVSQKKTPSFSKAIKFVDGLEKEELNQLKNRRILYEAQLAAFDAKEKSIKTSMSKSINGCKVDQVKIDAAVAELQTLQKPEEPRPRRFKTNDASSEKIGDILSYNPAGLLVYRDELMGLLSSWERAGNESARSFYLEGWNGTGRFSVDRIGRGELNIENHCLSVYGGIQPDLLQKYLTSMINNMENDGCIQRFQVLVYPDPVPWEWRDRYPVSGVRAAVRDLFNNLAKIDPVKNGATHADEFIKIPHFTFDNTAQEIFIEWATELHYNLIAKEENPLLVQHFGKFEKLFCSIALILHLASGHIGPVQEESALRAAAWCEYLAGHARRIYALIEAAKIGTAKMLSKRIADGKLKDGFTARDVWKKGWSGIDSTTTAEFTLAILEEHGWVLAIEDVADRGRPTTRYVVHPKARKGN